METNLYNSLCLTYGAALVDEELRLEEESSLLGYERFKRTLNKDAAAEGAAKTLTKEAIPVYAKKISSWLEKTETGKPGKRHSAAKLIKLCTPEQSAYVAIKAILSSVIGAGRSSVTLQKVASAAGSALEEQARFEYFISKVSKADRARIEGGLDKRVGLSYKKAYLRAYERFLSERDGIDAWRSLSSTEVATVGVKLVELFIQSTGLGSIYTQKYSPTSKHYAYFFELDKDVLNYLDFQNEELAKMCFIKRPMIIPPKKWSTPFDGGYYTKTESIVRIKKSLVKARYSEVDMPNVYRAVNTIQETAWRINHRVLEVANIIADMPHPPVELDFPAKDPDEKPYRDPICDTDEDKQREWRKKCVRYYQLENSRKGRRLGVYFILSTANTFAKYDRIYFPHNLDFRGRIYPLTSFGPQGSDFQKALITFADGVELGEQGHTWLAFHGANCFGLDKKPISDRLEWVYENSDLITRIASDPLSCLDWTSADSPWEFLAFCFEWAEYLEKGSSYVSHLPIAFDGSCSGIQHFSAMLRDEVGAVAVNLIPDNKVHDIYGIVADKVKEQLKKDLKDGTPDTFEKDAEGKEYLKKGTKSLAAEWDAYGITRYVTKRSVMTLPYGSKQFGFKDQILEDTIYPALDKNPIAFSRPTQAAAYMAKLIWDAVHLVVVKAMEAMQWLQESSALLAKDRDIHGNPIPVYWVTPAGFPVWQEYRKADVVYIKSVMSGQITIKIPDEDKKRTLEEGDTINPAVVKETENLDVRRQRQGIAPNFVHSMDASHLMLTVLACHDRWGINSFALIHDSFGTHAGKATDLFNEVRNSFVEMYTNNNVLQDLHDHIKTLLSKKFSDELPEVPQHGTLDLNVVRESLYAFA